jgi:hypothetical protein
MLDPDRLDTVAFSLACLALLALGTWLLPTEHAPEPVEAPAVAPGEPAVERLWWMPEGWGR